MNNYIATGTRLWAKRGMIFFFFVASQSFAGEVGTRNEALEMGDPSALSSSDLLFVESKTVEKERSDFINKLIRAGANIRPLYEAYIDIIGVNGILDGIEKLSPHCHSEGHDLGKVVFTRTRDIWKSLIICTNRCHSGCMHGVIMEAFSSAGNPHHGQLDLVALQPRMKEVCSANTAMTTWHSLGNCAHGVGHALTFLAGYDIREAVKVCAGFDDPAKEYYCATGAYMEYVHERDREDAKSKSLLYPCDILDYPAACARYKMRRVASRYYSRHRKLKDLAQECNKLTGKFRLGCFHGLGKAHEQAITHGRDSIKEVCWHGTADDQLMCIEGAVESMARYDENRARQVCEDLTGKNKETCLTAAKHKMYSMEKDLRLYLSK
jgi:hypothetical protein